MLLPLHSYTSVWPRTAGSIRGGPVALDEARRSHQSSTRTQRTRHPHRAFVCRAFSRSTYRGNRRSTRSTHTSFYHGRHRRSDSRTGPVYVQRFKPRAILGRHAALASLVRRRAKIARSRQRAGTRSTSSGSTLQTPRRLLDRRRPRALSRLLDLLVLRIERNIRIARTRTPHGRRPAGVRYAVR